MTDRCCAGHSRRDILAGAGTAALVAGSLVGVRRSSGRLSDEYAAQGKTATETDSIKCKCSTVIIKILIFVFYVIVTLYC